MAQRVDELHECLQSMTAEKEEAMARAIIAEEQNTHMKREVSGITSQLDVSVCLHMLCLGKFAMEFT